MDKTDAIGLGILGLFLIGLLVFLYGASKCENYTIKQYDNLEKICLKAYKTDLKNDNEIKELCKNVKVKLFAEGEITESDYQEVKSQRHDARVRINEL